MRILDGIDDIHFAELTSADVVRHRLVGDIVDAYAKSEEPELLNRAQRRASGAGRSATSATASRPRR
jgi:phosphate starvation-inducible PhoH-like protein